MVDVIDKFSIRLRFRLYLLPFGLESSPILLRFLPAGVLENIDEKVLRFRGIFGRPITNTLHVVPSEDRVDVITKASFESIHFALVDVIQTQFVNVVRRFRIRSAERAEAEHYRGPAKKR